MRFAVLLILTVLISGCAKTATETITETAQQQLNAIEQSIAPECRTASTTAQIEALRNTIKSSLSVCEVEKQKITADKLRWEAIAIMLMVIIGIHISKKFIK